MFLRTSLSSGPAACSNTGEQQQSHIRHLSPARRGDYLRYPPLERRHLLPSNGKTSGSTFEWFANDHDGHKKPTVLFFHTPAAVHKTPQVTYLEELARDIAVMGGQLIVISPAALHLWKKMAPASKSFSVYHDNGNKLAAQTGLYDFFNPTWKWMSGIDENIPLSAIYVVNANSRIRFRYIDIFFQLCLPGSVLNDAVRRQLLTHVYRNATGTARAAS